MRQRLGLAGALLGDPAVLILDEPANGLDPQGIRWLREFLRWFAANGNAVLVSSHLLSEMAQMADEVIVIDHGRLVRQGSVADLTAGARVAAGRLADHGGLRAGADRGRARAPRDGEAYVVAGAEAGGSARIAQARASRSSELARRSRPSRTRSSRLTEGAER